MLKLLSATAIAVLLTAPAIAQDAGAIAAAVASTDRPHSAPHSAPPAPVAEAAKLNPEVEALTARVKALSDDLARANLIIGSLQRQRNDMADRAALFETQAEQAKSAVKPAQ